MVLNRLLHCRKAWDKRVFAVSAVRIRLCGADCEVARVDCKAIGPDRDRPHREPLVLAPMVMMPKVPTARMHAYISTARIPLTPR